MNIGLLVRRPTVIISRRNGVTGAYLALLVAAVIVSSAATFYFAPARSSSPTVRTTVSKVVTTTRTEASTYTATSTVVGTNASLLGLDPVSIYRQASPSVVTVQGVQTSETSNVSVLGSGFVTQLQGSYYVITNYHVVHDMVDPTVTFSDGDAYPATVVGTDPYVDLAVVSVSAPSGEFHPLQVGNSSELVVGEPVVAIGNPYGLSGSMTFGIVSQLGRTLSESSAGSFAIADVIQFSAPINPGNSGGPLLDADGIVFGITTAIVSSSQGVGFAIPSDVIARELPTLVATGHYTLHSLMGIEGTDMTYQLAKIQGTNVTYGVLLENVTAGGPADLAGLMAGTKTADVQGSIYVVGGDIVIELNGTKIVDLDALSSYLQERTVPGQTLAVEIVRAGQIVTVDLVLGTRPPPPSG